MRYAISLLPLLSVVACHPGPESPGCDEPGGVNCPTKVFCGGIAGFPCPGAGTCIDDPSDDCDPKKGGADCGGMCVCNAMASCVRGYVWDESPAVCDCVKVADPCATVRCAAGTHCVAGPGGARCVADVNPCAATLCPVGTTCVPVGGEGKCVPADSVPCGSNTCAASEVCCNRSCGICTPPGGVCIQMACN